MSNAPLDEHAHPWFIDKDDGTVIHLIASGFSVNDGKVCPFAHIAFEQNVTLGDCAIFDNGGVEIFPTPPCGSPSAAFKNRLEFLDPLPDDFTFASGSISRFSDRLSMFLEEWTPSRIDEPTILAGQQILPMRTFITRYDFINIETLGTSNGTANQTFTPSGSEIKVPTRGTPIVFVGGSRFTVTDDLATAGPGDKVFEYDEDLGEVLFGNGINGAIPASELDIVLKVTVRNGGGQWEFVKIVLSPRSEAINIGNVKAIEDKIFYSEAKIAMASQSAFISIVTDLNGVDRKVFDRVPGVDAGTPVLLSSDPTFFLVFGGEVNASGGTITSFNTSAAGYVNPLPKASDDIIFASRTIKFNRQVVDTGITYPTIKTVIAEPDDIQETAESLEPFPVGDPTTAPQRYEEDFVDSGVITSPKLYDDTVSISPIVFARHLISVSGGVEGDTVFLQFRTNIPITTRPITAPGFDIRLIRMGHVTGTFDDPVDVATVFGNVQAGGGNHDGGDTLVMAGLYETAVPDALSEEFIITYEGRLTDTRKAVLTNYGSTIPPDFICTWTVNLNSLGVFCLVAQLPQALPCADFGGPSL